MAVLRVEHRCPQCGAPADLEETDRILCCRYCRVRLYISTSGPPRYCLPAEAPEGSDLVMVPYWRLRGMHFSLHPSGRPRSRVLDANFLASGLGFVPDTLGVRPQGTKLRFAAPAGGTRFLPHSAPADEAATRAERVSAASGLSAGRPAHSAFIGETTSLIYLPLYMTRGAIYDATLKRPIGRNTLMRAGELEAVEPPGRYSLDFVPALCPRCGWDLSGERNSVVLHCENCASSWRASKGRFEAIGFESSPADEQETTLVPFWRVRASIEGPVAEVRDCLPASLRRAWQDGEARFWLPAFRAAPRVYMRIARQATALQPQTERHRALPRGEFFPAALGVADVSGGLTVLLAAAAQARRRLLPLLPSVEVKAGGASLAYIPFKQRGSELVNSRLGLCIPLNSMRRAAAGASRAPV